MIGGAVTVWGNRLLGAGTISQLLAKSGLAWNAGVLTSVSPNRPFLNLAKQSNGWEADNAAEFTLNAQGYPTAMENGATFYQSFINLGAEETSLRSRWRLTWEGDGTMSAGANTNSAVTIDANTIEFTPDAVSNNLKIYWNITGFGTTGISNVSVVRVDRAALYDAGTIYEPVWMDRLSQAGQVRYLNWLSINSATNAPTLAGRKNDNHYTYGSTPIEVLVDISNKSNTNLWYLVNHQAPQDLVEFDAAYIRDNLNSHLKTIFEVTNEGWNSAFGQTEYYYARGLEYFRGTLMAGTMATTRGSSIVTGTGTAFTTELSVNDLVGIDGQFFIVNSVDSDTQFTSDSNRTATKTGSGFNGYFGSEFDHLDAYVYEATIKRDWFEAVHSTNVEFILNAQYASTTGVSSLIDAAIWQSITPSGGIPWEARNLKWDRIALGLYFGGGIINDAAKISALQALLDVNDDAGVSALVDSYIRLDEIGGLPNIITKLRGHERFAKAAGMSLDVYEEGPHISHSTGTSSVSDQQTVLDAQTVWRKSAECATFMSDFIKVHKAFLNGPYNHFDLHHAPSVSGDWGAYRRLDDPDAATDTMVNALIALPSEPVWYGYDIAPIGVAALPDIVADEFEEVTFETDICFSANTVSYSSPDLPDGLSIDAATGTVSGFLSGESSGVGTYTIVGLNASGSVQLTAATSIGDVATAAPDNPAYDGISWIDPSDAASYNVTGSEVDDITDKINGTKFTFSPGPIHDEITVNGQVVFKHFNRYSGYVAESAVSNLSGGFTFYSLNKVGIAGLTDTPIARFYGDSQDNFAHSFSSGLAMKEDKFFLKTTAGLFSVAASHTGADTAARLTTVVYDGVNLSIQVGDVTVSTPATGNVDLVSGDTSRIGRGHSGNNGVRSYLGETLICDRAHTPAEIADMQGYFNTKYGL